MKRVNAFRFLVLLAVLAACLLAAGISCAETKKPGGFTFEIQEDGTAKVIEYKGTLGNTENVELVFPRTWTAIRSPASATWPSSSAGS